VLFRGLEGLGEAFYFPASMSLISDFHGKQTRSKAMAFHQSSVYVGTIAGGASAGFFAQHYGWRSGFYVFGGLGTVLGIVLVTLLREPRRGRASASPDAAAASSDMPTLMQAIVKILSTPMVLVLIAVFTGANFVFAIFMTWMPTFLKEKFAMSLSMAGLNGVTWLQIGSVLGVVCGGLLADRLVRRHPAGRMYTQCIGLFLGAPFIFLTGYTLEVSVLIFAMIGFGYCKGLYDSNIWASLYDVVPPTRRATALGLMNGIGWFGAATAPVSIAAASERYGYSMSVCISATSMIYLVFGLILLMGAKLLMRRESSRPLEVAIAANHR